MNRFSFWSTLPVILVLFFSCEGKREPSSTEAEYKFSVTTASVGGRSATWEAGDIVYFSDNAAIRPGFQFTAAARDISADGKTLSAVYKKASPDAATVYALCGGKGRIRMKVTEDIPLTYDGRLPSAALPVGFATPGSEKITLSPTLPVAVFTLQNGDVSKVRINADIPVFPEKVRYDFGGAGLSILSRGAGALIPVSGKGPFYFPVVPGKGATSLSIEFLDGNDDLLRSVIIESVNVAATVGSLLDLGVLDKDAVGEDEPAFGEMERATVSAKNMGVGLNCGGGFEAAWESLLQNPRRDDPSYYETVARTNAQFAPKTFHEIAAAGYKSVRIPVTWHLHMDDYQTSDIDKVWIDRIEEVVGYAVDAGLYVVINMHHDAGSRVGRWCIADQEHYESTCAGLQNIWTRIATRFKDYDHHVLFEAFNEVLDDKNSWHYPKQESSYNIVNQYYQVFVDAVRATGGNNLSRNLILNTYGCSVREPAISHFRMPEDELPGHLFVQFHSYVPVDFCLESATDPRDNLIAEDEAAMREVFQYAKQYLVAKGYPCILGEYGSYPKEGRSQEDRVQYTYFMTKLCLENKVVPFIWYSPMSNKERDKGTWTDPEIRDAMIRAYNEHIAAQ